MPSTKPGRTGRQSVTQLAAVMRRQIAAGIWRPGDQLPVMRDLARDYGVSIGSVRRAVLKLEEEGLLARRWGSGVFVTHPSEPVPAIAIKSAQGATSDSVVILMPYDGHFYDRFTLRLCELAHKRGLAPVKLAPPWRTDSGQWSHVVEYFKQWQGRPPAAVIANTIPWHVGQAIEDAFAARSRLIGVMMYDGPMRPHLWHRIMSQTAILGEMAAERLYDAGHRRVGLITNVRRIMPDQLPRSLRKHSYGHTELILALGRGLRQRGGSGMLSVFYNQQLPHDTMQPFDAPELERMADYLCKPNRPTALIGQDFRLVAAARAWELAGLPLRELPVRLGIGNTPWAHDAGFDSYCHQPEVMADHAIALLDEPPAPLSPARKIRITPQLVPHGQHVSQDLPCALLP